MLTRDAFENAHKLLRQGQYDQAFSLLYDVKNSNLRHPYGRDQNHSFYMLGDICFKKADFASAIAFFQKSLADRRDDPEALLALANSYSEAGNPGVTALLLSAALKTRPNDDILLYNYGNALFDQGKFRGAIAQYAKVSKKDANLNRLAKRNTLAATWQRKSRAGKGRIPSIHPTAPRH